MQGDFWKGKRVFLTGHTGFKGAWLALWLNRLGAEVTGYALAPETPQNLFDSLGLEPRMTHILGDLGNLDLLSRALSKAEPDIVFHLAAQSLVRRSYREPLTTWQTNVMGTANLLQATRLGGNRRMAMVIVTTDKVYENREWVHAYRETDNLGGHDPYAASKAAAELLVSSWVRSFSAPADGIRIATARAGNVIGGGDWAEDRILPDIARALAANEPVRLRNPEAVRPWQHVLDPLHGYLTLARQLWEGREHLHGEAINFGPDNEASRTVEAIAEAALAHWPGSIIRDRPTSAPHEANLLRLTTEKAQYLLGWRPVWEFETAVRRTIEWYRESKREHSAAELCAADIDAFEAA